MKYSQNNEQEIILNFFNGRIGSYLDIGAFDGVGMSNTLALAELGWQGTAVEASPWVFKRLKSNYEKRQLTSRVKLIEAAAVPDSYPDQMTFYETRKMKDSEPGFGVGSFCKEHAFKQIINISNNEFREMIEITVPTVKVSNLLSTDSYNFISIDVEEFNLELMISMPWHLQPELELICVEEDLAPYRFVNFMKPLGWKLLKQESYNLFFIRS
jgi:FkbM family methyltransferase